MKPAIPNSVAVMSAFRTVEKRLKKAQKRINAQAAREMKSGDYGSAQKWMDVGSAVADFAGRSDAFAEEWKRLTKATRIVNTSVENNHAPNVRGQRNSTKTPSWKFCTTALSSLVEAGGVLRHEDIVEAIQRSMATLFTEKDRKPGSIQGQPRWHDTVKKAFKQCQHEGWIEKRSDGMWKITSNGRSVQSGHAGASGTPPAPSKTQ